VTRPDPDYDQWTGSDRDSERERVYDAIDHRRSEQKEAALERSAMVGGPRLLTIAVDLNAIGPAIAESIANVLRNRGLSLSADIIAELGNNVAQVVVSCEVDQ
jgi:hypothetical protein